MHPAAFFTQKSMEELLLIMMGDDAEQLRQDGHFLGELITQDVEEGIGCRATFAVGSIQQRLTNIHLSFIDALAALNSRDDNISPSIDDRSFDLVETSKLDRLAVERYLKTGLIGEFDAFFDEHLEPISQAALHSSLIKHYLFVDVVLTSAQFVADLGGVATEVIPMMSDLESLLAGLQSVDEIRRALKDVVAGVLAYRNGQAQREKSELIFQAKAYIDANFSDPDLLLEDVASKVNLSPSHFSVVFGRETGESFKSYLTGVRIECAKELLRTTDLKCYEIAHQSGYNDPHYFSYAFKKSTGMPPQQFRQLVG
jgi:two-component system response regulator YesN